MYENIEISTKSVGGKAALFHHAALFDKAAFFHSIWPLALALRLFFVAVQPLSLLVSPMVVEGVAFEHQSKGARTGPIASKKSNSIKIFKKAVV